MNAIYTVIFVSLLQALLGPRCSSKHAVQDEEQIPSPSCAYLADAHTLAVYPPTSIQPRLPWPVCAVLGSVSTLQLGVYSCQSPSQDFAAERCVQSSAMQEWPRHVHYKPKTFQLDIVFPFIISTRSRLHGNRTHSLAMFWMLRTFSPSAIGRSMGILRLRSKAG